MGFLDNLGNLKGNLGTQRESSEIRMTLENIARADGEIQEKIFQLGQKYYEENKNKETGELSQPYASIIDAVKKLEENRKGFFKNKLRLEGQMMCENCGAIIPYGSVFCNQCGKKADEVSGAERHSGCGVRDPGHRVLDPYGDWPCSFKFRHEESIGHRLVYQRECCVTGICADIRGDGLRHCRIYNGDLLFGEKEAQKRDGGRRPDLQRYSCRFLHLGRIDESLMRTAFLQFSGHERLSG